MVGFVDDTNLIIYNNDIATNCEYLECIWIVYKRWIMIRGMIFTPKKSELIHFTQVYILSKQMIQLLGTDVTSVESARFLRIWLDQKLRWYKHLKIIQAKLSKQQYAFIKLAVSIWRMSLVHIRELYIKVICNAIVYRTSA